MFSERFHAAHFEAEKEILKEDAAVKEAAPQARIVAVHMDTVAHACLTRPSLRLLLDSEGAPDVLMPADGETLVFEDA